jgi:hypothetical protein
MWFLGLGFRLCTMSGNFMPSRMKNTCSRARGRELHSVGMVNDHLALADSMLLQPPQTAQHIHMACMHQERDCHAQ